MGKAVERSKRRRWCALYGFNINNKDKTGYLGFRDERELRANPRLGLYKIVKCAEEAAHFPCENYLSNPDFAPPEKWLEFFKKERELSQWRFHLVTRIFVKSPLDISIFEKSDKKTRRSKKER